jgi:hypothetical protein
MTKYELLSVVISAIAAGISLIAVFVAGRANSINKNIFRRQGVIDLHMAWQGVNEIDSLNLIGPDVARAVSALSLTAALWNHDVIDKNILYQTYWEPYKNLYEKLYFNDNLVPGYSRTCKSFVTSEIQKAYEQMRTVDLEKVTQTKL